MKLANMMREGIKLVVLFGAVALVVWSMPESTPPSPPHAVEQLTANH